MGQKFQVGGPVLRRNKSTVQCTNRIRSWGRGGSGVGGKKPQLYNMKITLRRSRCYNVLHTKITKFTSLTLNLTWLTDKLICNYPIFLKSVIYAVFFLNLLFFQSRILGRVKQSYIEAEKLWL